MVSPMDPEMYPTLSQYSKLFSFVHGFDVNIFEPPKIATASLMEHSSSKLPNFKLFFFFSRLL